MSDNLSEEISPNEQLNVVKKKMPLWFKLAMIAVILAFIGFSGGLLFTETLIDVPQKQLQAIKEGNIDKAYQKYSSSQFMKNVSEEKFTEVIGQNEILKTYMSAIFPERTIDHKLAVVRGKLFDAADNEATIKYKLIKENGKWKVLNFRVGKLKVKKSK